MPDILKTIRNRYASAVLFNEQEVAAWEDKRKELAEAKPDWLPLCDANHKWETVYKGEWIALDTNGKAIRVNVKY